MNAGHSMRIEGQKTAGQQERSSDRARTEGSSAQEFTPEERARLARMESRPAVDLAADVAEERVAEAIFHEAWGARKSRRLADEPEGWQEYFRRQARAALSAVPPADEARERDDRPHSRACGWRKHEHGRECHANCPTCGGYEMRGGSR